MTRRSVDVTRPITVESLEDKVRFISALTGIDFRFIPGTVRGSNGYVLKPRDPKKETPYFPDGMIGRSRHEANKTLDAILAGIGFVAGLPAVPERDF